jgi:hypothetical protein
VRFVLLCYNFGLSRITRFQVALQYSDLFSLVGLLWALTAASAVIRSPHRLGVDPIADELIMRFGDFGLDGEEGPGEGDSQTDNGFGTECGVDMEPSDAAVDFRDRIGKILRNNGNSFAVEGDFDGGDADVVGADPALEAGSSRQTSGVPNLVSVKTTKSGKPSKVLGGTLDKDLKAYFVLEDQNRQLSNLGFFERDNFMDFD